MRIGFSILPLIDAKQLTISVFKNKWVLEFVQIRSVL